MTQPLNDVVYIVPGPWIVLTVSYMRGPSRQRMVRKLSNIIGSIWKETRDMESMMDKVHGWR